MILSYLYIEQFFLHLNEFIVNFTSKQ